MARTVEQRGFRGMQLNTHEWGSGDRTALLVHGIMSDHRTWRRVGPALAERGYRVIAVDLRGHGASPRGEGATPLERYGPGQYAQDLVDTLPIGAELAIGHSLGGLALLGAVERLEPARVVYSDPAWRFAQPNTFDPGCLHPVQAGHPGADHRDQPALGGGRRGGRAGHPRALGRRQRDRTLRLPRGGRSARRADRPLARPTRRPERPGRSGGRGAAACRRLRGAHGGRRRAHHPPRRPRGLPGLAGRLDLSRAARPPGGALRSAGGLRALAQHQRDQLPL
ncbi:alpha/beta fold hydrolase [Kitasatospora sp. NPDC059327]|uniref:alpha/beta fold hydrolase n=1 Tax=Kitasatospora sp. NPDC059327 TaxID=3346803 RepID=UPI0036972470